MPDRKFTVFVDPGHGGADPGAIGAHNISRDQAPAFRMHQVEPSQGDPEHMLVNVKESIINSFVSLGLGQELTALGCQIAHSRISDSTMSLQERSDQANSLDIDLFVSIHCNSAQNSHASGFEVFHYFGSAAGQKAAEMVYEQYLKSVTLAGFRIRERGVKEGNYHVLRETAAPAILVELGFLSNLAECVYLVNSNAQIAMVQGIARGVMNYKRYMEESFGLKYL